MDPVQMGQNRHKYGNQAQRVRHSTYKRKTQVANGLRGLCWHWAMFLVQYAVLHLKRHVVHAYS